MGATERIIRIVVTVLILALGLIFLNHSLYSFWVSGGPPNDYPNVWYHQGIISSWRGLALLALSVFVQFRWVTLKSSWLVRLLALIMLVGLAYPYIKEWVLIDRCLDNGGSWSSEYFKCNL